MTQAEIFLKELEAEAPATRKCLEAIPESLFEYKPHERSMKMGYLCLMMADIPRWITSMIEEGEIDFGTWGRSEPETTAQLLELFDTNLPKTKQVLQNVSDEDMTKIFRLKNQGQELMASPLNDSISSTLNHWVHHRGQLTVYMRLNELAVPSIYGPSADDQSF